MRPQRMRSSLVALVALALIEAGPAAAQAPAPEAAPPEGAAAGAAAPPAEAGTAGEAAEPAEPVERPPLDVEMDTDGYTYQSRGRRDPFVSLQRPVEPERGATRPRGVEGFLIQEVALRGIVRTSGGGTGIAAEPGYIAIFQGPDPTKSYFVRTGQRLYDGVITAVDATSVTFRQDVTDPLSPVKSREVTKSLYAEEEARQ
jgi:hypothetical protein